MTPDAAAHQLSQISFRATNYTEIGHCNIIFESNNLHVSASCELKQQLLCAALAWHGLRLRLQSSEPSKVLLRSGSPSTKQLHFK